MSGFDELLFSSVSIPEIYSLEPASLDDVRRAIDEQPEPLLRKRFLVSEQEEGGVYHYVPIAVSQDGWVLMSAVLNKDSWWNQRALAEELYAPADLVPQGAEGLVGVPPELLSLTRLIPADELPYDVVLRLDGDPLGRRVYEEPKEGWPLSEQDNELLYRLYYEPESIPVERLPEPLQEVYSELQQGLSEQPDEVEVEVEAEEPAAEPQGSQVDENYVLEGSQVYLKDQKIMEPSGSDPRRLLSLTPSYRCTQLHTGFKWYSNNCFYDNILFAIFHPDLEFFENQILNLNLEFYYRSSLLSAEDQQRADKMRRESCVDDAAQDLKIKQRLQRLLRIDVLNLRKNRHYQCMSRQVLRECSRQGFTPGAMGEMYDPLNDVFWPLLRSFGLDSYLRISEKKCILVQGPSGPATWKQYDPVETPNMSISLTPLRADTVQGFVDEYQRELSLEREETEAGTYLQKTFDRWIARSPCLPLYFNRLQQQWVGGQLREVRHYHPVRLDRQILVNGVRYRLLSILISDGLHYTSCIACHDDRWLFFHDDPSDRARDLEAVSWEQIRQSDKISRHVYMCFYQPIDGPEEQVPYETWLQRTRCRGGAVPRTPEASETTGPTIKPDQEPPADNSEPAQAGGAITSEPDIPKQARAVGDEAGHPPSRTPGVSKTAGRSDAPEATDRSPAGPDELDPLPEPEQSDELGRSREPSAALEPSMPTKVAKGTLNLKKREDGNRDQNPKAAAKPGHASKDHDTTAKPADDSNDPEATAKSGAESQRPTSAVASGSDVTDGIAGQRRYLYYYHDHYDPQHRWLNNTSPHPVTIDGVYYPTVEHYYQFMKFLHGSKQPPELSKELALKMILELEDPIKARQLTTIGGDLRRHMKYDCQHWLAQKQKYLMAGRLQKLLSHPELKQQLLDTKDSVILERVPYLDTIGRSKKELDHALQSSVYYDETSQQWYGNYPKDIDTWMVIREQLAKAPAKPLAPEADA